jgi:hypothetical protein
MFVFAAAAAAAAAVVALRGAGVPRALTAALVQQVR